LFIVSRHEGKNSVAGIAGPYKYTGHVINFLRDVGKVYRKLPLLPQDLDVVLLHLHGLGRNILPITEKDVCEY